MNASNNSSNAMTGTRVYVPVTNALNEAFRRPVRVEAHDGQQPAMIPVADFNKFFR